MAVKFLIVFTRQSIIIVKFKCVSVINIFGLRNVPFIFGT